MPPPSSSSTFTSRRYALVIDAGSSGSRMQIYSWKDPRAEREEVRASSSGTASDPKGKGRQQEDLSKLRRLPRVERGVKEGSGDWQKKVEPGLSTLALAPISHSAVSSYLSPLLAHAKASIPPSLHSSTPVYILATAGMRLLPPETSDALIQASCDVLRQEFPFRVENEGPEGPCGGSVRVISGEEEGLWGWVAVNYLMDGFGDPNALEPTTETVEEEDDPYFATSSSSSLSTAAPSTYGFLDMGGASTQIAFSPSPQEAASHRSSLSSVKLRLLSGEDMDFSVFVASWLGYGTNKARERYVGLKVEEWETSLRPSTSSSIPEPSIPDPCLPKSLLLSESPKIPHSHLATASSSSVNHLLSTHSLVGTGSFPECLKSLQPLLNKHLPCPSPHECLFDGLPTPKIDFEQQRFIGVSEYWYSSEHVFNMGGAWDFLEFERKAGEFCAREWGEIEKGYERSRKLGELPHSGDGEVLDADGRVVEMGKWGAEVEIPRLQMQCFKAAWLVNVLHEGIGLPRVVDPGGGHLSSSSSPLSKTDLEAARKAKQKGLGGPSFQSIDTVGDTAISWTLGKMVIEASRDVPPALPSSSYTDWVSLPDRLLGIDHLMEGRLDRLGGGSYFAYGFVLLGVLLLFFVKFRRRVFRVASPVRRVNRWKKDLEESDEYEEEESFVGGNGNGGPSLRPRSPNRNFLKSWFSAVSFGIRRILRHSPASTFLSSDRPSTLKHARSSPAISSTNNAPIRRSASAFFAASTGYYPSPPSSPRKKAFRPPSIDAAKAQADSHGLGIEIGEGGGGGGTPETATMHSSTPTPFSPKSTQLAGGGGGGTNSGPPRASRRPSPQAGAGSVDFHLLPLNDILGKPIPSSLYSIAQGGNGSGWNDPPNDIFAGRSSSSGPATIEEGIVMSGTLTPPASHSGNGGVGGSMSASSRNSSRVDLSGLAGLTGRSVSRNSGSEEK